MRLMDLCTTNLVTATPTERIVVRQAGRLIGIVTVDDVLEWMGDEIDDIDTIVGGRAADQTPRRADRRSRAPLAPSWVDAEC